MNEYLEIGKVVAAGIAGSKPLTKLIEQFGEAMGIITKPWRIVREAKAESKAIEIKAYVEQKAMLIQDNAKTEKDERTIHRLLRQENIRQSNLEKVFIKSTSHLNEETSAQQVDEDWRTRFINNVQDVSSEDLQEIWAKILGNEISEPGKVSLRTLDVLKNLTKSEAEIFQKICAITTRQGVLCKDVSYSTSAYIEKFGISYDEILIMRSAGLMLESETLQITFQLKDLTFYENHWCAHLIYGDVAIFIGKEKAESLRIPSLSLTNEGLELARIINIASNRTFVDDLVARFSKMGYYVKVFAVKE